MLTNIHLDSDQTMDSYFRPIKSIVDSLVAIQSLTSDFELNLVTTIGLTEDYNSFVTTFSVLPSSTSFHDL